jgi:hypothetical protein
MSRKRAARSSARHAHTNWTSEPERRVGGELSSMYILDVCTRYSPQAGRATSGSTGTNTAAIGVDGTPTAAVQGTHELLPAIITCAQHPPRQLAGRQCPFPPHTVRCEHRPGCSVPSLPDAGTSHPCPPVSRLRPWRASRREVSGPPGNLERRLARNRHCLGRGHSPTILYLYILSPTRRAPSTTWKSRGPVYYCAGTGR